MRVELLNGANLAFIGDAYYELYIRKYCLNKGITNQKELHKECVKYVSAHAHYQIFEKLEKENFFSEKEMVYFKRGRNHSYHANRKNVNPSEYVISSGFESLIGYLYMSEENQRLEELMKKSIEIIEGKDE